MEKLLFDFPEIIEKMKQFFLEIPTEIRSDLSDLIIKQSNIDIETLKQVEAILKTKLPESFQQIILQYDCGDLTLGGVWFGNKENYAEYLVKNNIKQETVLRWWGIGERPYNYLLIAGSDGYVILLNTETAQIMAYARWQSYQDSKLIASDFTIFFQAAATIYIRNRTGDNSKDILMKISEIVGSTTDSEFWHEIIM